jgi:hypothetical protein
MVIFAVSFLSQVDTAKPVAPAASYTAGGAGEITKGGVVLPCGIGKRLKESLVWAPPSEQLRVCPSVANGCSGVRCPPFCHPEETTCLWPVKRGMTSPNRHGCEARRAGGPNFSPARKGWGFVTKTIGAP